MSNRGFSGTTVAIIVLLLVALFGIGHIPGINPPPEQPEKPQPPPPSARDTVKNLASAQRNNMKEMMMKQMKDKMGAQHPKMAPSKPVKDPNSIDATPAHFFQTPDGAQGIKVTQEMVAKQKAEYDRYMKQSQSYLHTKKAALMPSDAPPPTAVPKPGNPLTPVAH